ncbi:MAG: chaperone NapD [bacterium]|nr:chaperone NapD [bacterium]
MNISGILVHAAPAKYEKVKEALLALPDIEIPVDNPDGRMVVIIDEAGGQPSGESLMKIQGIDGVLTANLVYQHIEEEGNSSETSILEEKNNANHTS